MKHIRKIVLIFFISLTITVKGQSVGGTISGAASYCSNANSGFLSLTGYTGTIVGWELSNDGGITWTNTGNMTSTQSYFNLTQTSCYRAIVQDLPFPPDTSFIACITVYSPSIGGVINGGGVFCGGSGNGTLNLTGNTGNVLFWQYSIDGGVSWTAISNTTSTLNYSNINQNTLYSVVVQNGATCPTDTSSQASFSINPISIAGTLSGNDTVCYGANTIMLNLSGTTGNVLFWLTSTDNGMTWNQVANNDTSQIYTNLTQTTWYEAIVQNGTCDPDTSLAVIVFVLPANPVNAGNDTTILSGQSVLLNGIGNGTPLWTPSSGLDNANIFTPLATPANSVSYILSVSDSNSCISSDTILIFITQPEFSDIIPNVFTPNDDGINDFFEIKNISNENTIPLQIFDRWGILLYSSDFKTVSWDGRTTSGMEVSAGIYYYTITIDKKLFNGFIKLVR